MLGTAASCATQQEDDVTAYSSSASEIIFPDGSTIPVDLPMPTKELMDKVEQKGGSYEIYGIYAPSVEGVDPDRVYIIYTDYDSEDQVKRDYFAYEEDDMIVYLRKSFGLENPYPRWWNVFSWFSG
jgi:guanyl-specific ribonuclease Sa